MFIMKVKNGKASARRINIDYEGKTFIFDSTLRDGTYLAKLQITRGIVYKVNSAEVISPEMINRWEIISTEDNATVGCTHASIDALKAKSALSLIRGEW